MKMKNIAFKLAVLAIVLFCSNSDAFASCSKKLFNMDGEPRRAALEIESTIKNQVENALLANGFSGTVLVRVKNLDAISKEWRWSDAHYSLSVILDDGTRLVTGDNDIGGIKDINTDAYEYHAYDTAQNLIATHCYLTLMFHDRILVNKNNGRKVLVTPSYHKSWLFY